MVLNVRKWSIPLQIIQKLFVTNVSCKMVQKQGIGIINV